MTADRKTILRAALLASLAAGFAPPSFAQLRTVAVESGTLAGESSEGIASFKGIPYAAPPVGELRWQPPRKPLPWPGTKLANRFAPSCMQDPNYLTLFSAPREMSEDCLHLNIWTPAKSAREHLPVMVWIYGGGFGGGSTAVPMYDGQKLASMGVVLVTVSYRVGAFGFLAHPELSRESGKGSGTYGLQDQIAALKWVQSNIARFGGDAGRVTIFGESAGAVAVSMLAASPRARGLFHRAISQSGGNFAPPRRGDSEPFANMPTLEAAETSGRAFLAKLGVADLRAARALSAEAVQKAVPPGSRTGFWPPADGDVLPGDQHGLYSQDKFNHTPVLIGTNSHEGGVFVPPGMNLARFREQVLAWYGRHADAVMAAYAPTTDTEAVRAFADLFRDTSFAWPTWTWARLQSSDKRNPAYVYYFDRRAPKSPDGSFHGADIPYLFGNIETPNGPLPSAADDPQARPLSTMMMQYWINFARTGNPNVAGLPDWPPFDSQTSKVMIFDANPGARTLPNMTQLQVMENYFNWRRARDERK